MRRGSFSDGYKTTKTLSERVENVDSFSMNSDPAITLDWFAKKIISGGQTGADMGGLLFAEMNKIPTGGWSPKGWRTENGSNPELDSRFGLKEAPFSGYNWRTERNAIESDATVIFSRNPKSAGTVQTVRFCIDNNKEVILVDPFAPDAAEKVLGFLSKHEPKVLNIAGNRQSVASGIEQQVVKVMNQVLVLSQASQEDKDNSRGLNHGR